MHTKQELLAQLANARNNYLLGLASLSLLTTPASMDILRQNEASFGPYHIQFDFIAKMLEHEGNRTIALGEFLTMHYRALTKECFEALRDYCETSKQLGKVCITPC